MKTLFDVVRMIREEDGDGDRKKLRVILPGSEGYVSVRDLQDSLTLVINEIDVRNAERQEEFLIELRKIRPDAPSSESQEFQQKTFAGESELRNNAIGIVLLTALSVVMGIATVVSYLSGLSNFVLVFLGPMAISVAGLGILYYSRVRMMLDR